MEILFKGIWGSNTPEIELKENIKFIKSIHASVAGDPADLYNWCIEKEILFGEAYWEALKIQNDGILKGCQLTMPPSRLVYSEFKKLLEKYKEDNNISQNEDIDKYLRVIF